MTISIQELQALREEQAAKQIQVEELARELAQLEAELARLKGEEPGVEPPAAEVEKPLYKRWSFWIPVGGITAAIAGIVAYKKKRKK